MVSKRELVLNAFQGKNLDRVPVGFWYHFIPDSEKSLGLTQPDIFQRNVEGHRQFVEAASPDFVKIMSDGYFNYPQDRIKPGVTSVAELVDLPNLPEDHPWFTEQVKLVQEVRTSFSEDIVSIYNIFAPATYLKWQLSGKIAQGNTILANLLKEDPEGLKEILDTIARDVAKLAVAVVSQGGADGIYFSAQNIQDPRVSREDYERYIKPSEVFILEAVNQVSQANVLHICGYEGAKNDLSLYQDYPAQVINWAVSLEGIGLEEGRALFGNRPVLGGFDNSLTSILVSGSREEVVAATQDLLAGTEHASLILGADCTVPDDFNPERIDWVRQAATAAKGV